MDEMTIGEISRSLARLEKSQSEQTVKLDEIKEETSKTNGYVGRHEVRLNGLDREIRDIKRAHHHPPTPPGPPSPYAGESFSAKISPGIWKLIAAGAGAAGAMLLQKLAGQ